MRIRSGIAAGLVVLSVASCGDDETEADACDELQELSNSEDSDALASDAEDPDGAFAKCIDQIGDQIEEMSPEEREAFLNGD